MVKILLHAKDKFLLIFIITSIIYSNEDIYKQLQSELILA